MTEQIVNPVLPSWAKKVKEDGIDKVIVDIDVAYPLYLQELNMAANQYSVSLAQQMVIRDVQELMGGRAWIRLHSSVGDGKYAVNKLPIHVKFGAAGDEMGRQQANFKFEELKAAREAKKNAQPHT